MNTLCGTEPIQCNSKQAVEFKRQTLTESANQEIANLARQIARNQKRIEFEQLWPEAAKYIVDNDMYLH